MPWKRHSDNRKLLLRVALLAAISAGAGVLACCIGDGAVRVLSGFSDKAAYSEAIAVDLAEDGR